MRKALLTVRVGPEAEQLAQYSWPTFWRYACEHGYSVIEQRFPLDARPPSWSKLPAMLELWGGWDTIVCIDIDAMIVQFDRDYFQEVLNLTDAAVGFAVEGFSRAPNCGMWIVRGKDHRSYDFLNTVNKMDRFYNDAVFEQAAVHYLLGYDPGIPSAVHSRNTVLLPPEYNDCCFLCPRPIVKHWAGQRHHDRLAGMSQTLRELGL